MIYELDYPNTRMHVDTDKIAKRFIDGRHLFVSFFVKEDRIKLIEFLESEGFYCLNNQSYSRQATIDSGFPLVIEMKEKYIYHLGNVTCSAAAAGSGIIMSDKNFYLLYSLHLQQQKIGGDSDSARRN